MFFVNKVCLSDRQDDDKMDVREKTFARRLMQREYLFFQQYLFDYD